MAKFGVNRWQEGGREGGEAPPPLQSDKSFPCPGDVMMLLNLDPLKAAHFCSHSPGCSPTSCFSHMPRPLAPTRMLIGSDFSSSLIVLKHFKLKLFKIMNTVPDSHTIRLKPSL